MRNAIQILPIVLVLVLIGYANPSSADPTTRPASEDRTLGDLTMYTKGPYSAFMMAFNAKKLGLTGTESMRIKPTFPAGTELTWSWPKQERPMVIGFLQVAGYGNYYSTVPETPITPKRVKEIKTLTASHDLTISGTDNGFNVIYDYFLTQTANGNDNHLFEIEVFLHTSGFAAGYVKSVTPIGTTTISGIEWTVVIDSHPKVPDILFMPSNQADVPASAIDLKAMHDYLIAQGKLTGEEFYNGHSLGVEPGQGSGSLTVHSASVTYH